MWGTQHPGRFIDVVFRENIHRCHDDCVVNGATRRSAADSRLARVGGREADFPLRGFAASVEMTVTNWIEMTVSNGYGGDRRERVTLR